MNITESYKVGTRIYYTGDMANGNSIGTITAIHSATQISPVGYDIEYDDERFEGDNKKSHSVPIHCFSPGPGRRFYLLDEWIDKKNAEIKKVYAEYGINV